MNILNITRDNFEHEVLKSDVPVLIDFWATWCGPCKMISPIVDEIASEVNETVKVCKINIDEEPELADTFKVMKIPTFALIKDGKVIKSSTGVQPKHELLHMLQID